MISAHQEEINFTWDEGDIDDDDDDNDDDNDDDDGKEEDGMLSSPTPPNRLLN